MPPLAHSSSRLILPPDCVRKLPARSHPTDSPDARVGPGPRNGRCKRVDELIFEVDHQASELPMDVKQISKQEQVGPQHRGTRLRYFRYDRGTMVSSDLIRQTTITADFGRRGSTDHLCLDMGTTAEPGSATTRIDIRSKCAADRLDDGHADAGKDGNGIAARRRGTTSSRAKHKDAARSSDLQPGTTCRDQVGMRGHPDCHATSTG